MKTKYFIALILLFIINGNLFSNETVLRAMRDEISRSLKELKLESVEKPYYIEYKLVVRNSSSVKASLGSIQESAQNKTAQLTVGVRVGDYKLDNTNFFDFGLSLFGSGDDEERFTNRTIPNEIDYQTLRRELWLASDAAYKQVAEIYSKKMASMKNRPQIDTTPDFIKLPAERNIDTSAIPNFEKEKIENLCRKLSAIFQNYPQIDVSTVSVEYLPETTYYVNSEGREYIRTDFYIGLESVAYLQGNDGMPLANFYSCYNKSSNALPGEDSLKNAIETLAKSMLQLSKSAAMDEPYSGPIIFEGQAAAELIAQAFAPNLVTQRQPLTESGMQESDRFTAFQSKIGARVLPEFMSVEANPLLKKYENTELMGAYKIDDDGILAEQVNLVEKGYLKNLLSSRNPIRRVKKSNGHQRGAAPMLSNIFISADEEHSKTSAELKEKMIDLVKSRELPFGIIVKRVLNQNILYTTLFRVSGGEYPMPSSQSKITVLEAYKVFPDGREELFRGTVANGFSTASFKDIIFTGDSKYAMNYLAPAVISPYISGGRQYLVSSIICPDLLFEDGEIKQNEGDFPKKIILSNPFRK